MEVLLDKLDTQFGELVSRISHLDKLQDQPAKIAELDKEFVQQITHIKQQLSAARELEELRNEASELDKSINSILIELAQCRRELEQFPRESVTANERKVNSNDLLDYAAKITKFTRQMPGNTEMNLLPWPAEDQLRRGMLATLTIQEETGVKAVEEPAAELPMEEPTMAKAPEPVKTDKVAKPRAAPRQKISLDFDSDDD